MGKKTDNQNDPASDQLEPGTVILTGASRDEIATKFDELKASAKDAHLIAGAVGRNIATGTFELRIDIVNS